MVGCASYPETTRCAAGLAEVEGQCVPVSTVVFRQCMEAFRTESVEHDRGHELSIAASTKRYGEAKVQRSKQDLQRTEFAGAAPGDSEIVVAECRRQEQAERESQLQQAWAVAASAEAEAQAAEREKADMHEQLAAARAEIEAQQRAYAEAAEALAAVESKLGDVEGELAAYRDRIASEHPCTAEVWPACAEAAAQAHAAGDHKLAHEQYALACAAEHGAACGNWGLLFEHGLATPADPARARELYARGCELDDMNACASLATALQRDGKQQRRAAELAQKACHAGIERACVLVTNPMVPVREDG
jgi:hypothetical protein